MLIAYLLNTIPYNCRINCEIHRLIRKPNLGNGKMRGDVKIGRSQVAFHTSEVQVGFPETHISGNQLNRLKPLIDRLMALIG